MAGGELKNTEADKEMATLATPALTRAEQALAERELRLRDSPRYGGGPPRTLPGDVNEDVASGIGSMLARGWEPRVIRRSLKISRRQYDRAMKEVLSGVDDRALIFAKYKAANASNLRQIASIRQRALAMQPPSLLAAIRATLAMKEIHTAIVQVGQSLGYYRSVQPEARATLDDQDARRELPNLEGSEAADAIDDMADMLEEWRERDEPVSEDPETGQVTILMQPEPRDEGGGGG